jgi:rhodanese-related sulfurtransferase
VWQHFRITRRGIDEVLAAAQARLRRLTPEQAATAMHQGSLLVDTRDGELRSRDGSIPGSVHIPLSVLEWRVDPTSGHQSPALAGHEDKLILICNEGYSSSLAAVRLHDLGFENTTDVVGGFVAWAAAHLPVELPRANAPDRTPG